METKDRAVDQSGEPEAEFQSPDPSADIGKADNLHNFVETQQENAAGRDTQPGTEKQASRWWDRSAEYVRQFDYEQADAGIREYIGQKPWRSILIAGGIGLIAGAVLRRR